MGTIEGILVVIGLLVVIGAVVEIVTAVYEGYSGTGAASEQEAAYRRGMEAASRISAAAFEAEQALYHAAREEER